MHINKFIEILDSLLPKATAADFDKVGLQIQSGKKDIDKILCAFEINNDVIDEAIKLNCDSILAFHPLIFHAIYSITDDDRVGSLISRLIENKIALFIAHTNFDAYKDGTSRILADKLGLINIDFLEPDKNIKDCGMGIVGELPAPTHFDVILEKLEYICKSPLKYSATHKSCVRKLAIVGGSGSSYLDQAISAGADVFITADISYHAYHKAAGNIALIDPGHYEMEQFVIKGLYNLISKNINEIEMLESKTLTNPICYYPDSGKYQNMQLNNLL